MIPSPVARGAARHYFFPIQSIGFPKARNMAGAHHEVPGPIFLVVSLFVAAGAVRAAEVRVDSLLSLHQAIEAAKPGEEIILANGQYVSDGPIEIAAAGTDERPIIIRGHPSVGWRFAVRLDFG